MPSPISYAKWSEDFGKSFSGNDQDDVLYHMIKSDEFLNRCIRRKIDAKIFSSRMRQKYCKMILDYYDKYTKAPTNDFITVISTELEGGFLFTDDEVDGVAVYAEKLFSRNVTRGNADFLDDRLDYFLRDRIAQTALGDMIKLSGRPNVKPDGFLGIMSKAVVEANLMTGRDMVESLLDETDYDFQSDVITRFNIPIIDNAMNGGFKAGQFGMIFGFTGRGKTWSIIHLAKIAARFGHTSLLICIELSNKVFKLRVRQALTGLTRFELGDVSNFRSMRRTIKDSMVRKADMLFLGDDEKSLSVSELPSIMSEIKDKKGLVPDLILIDSADDMNPPPGKYNSRTEKLTEIYTYLKNFAKDNDICTITTSQAIRKTEKKKWLYLSDVGEDINKARRSNVVIILNGLDDEMKVGLNRLSLAKYSDGQAGARCYVYQSLGRGQFVLDSGKYVEEGYKLLLERLKEEKLGAGQYGS